MLFQVILLQNYFKYNLKTCIIYNIYCKYVCNIIENLPKIPQKPSVVGWT